MTDQDNNDFIHTIWPQNMTQNIKQIPNPHNMASNYDSKYQANTPRGRGSYGCLFIAAVS